MPLSLARQQAVGRLLALDERGQLTTQHVQLAASAAGVAERTVWRWLRVARVEGRSDALERDRFVITDQIHARLVRWRGNAAAVHRELVAEARAAAVQAGEAGQATGDGVSLAGVPSLATVHRAIRRDLNTGQRAALRGGEKARRGYDVHLRRPRAWRNACWEGDHKHVPVQVDLDGVLVCPWITWFIDCATNAVTGVAVTPHQPSRDAILAALRVAISRDGPSGPYGPIGGLPSLVRVDRGRDFLSRTVAAALNVFAVPVQDLPAYTPHLKGTVENLNRAVETMFLASLPRYTRAPTASPRPRRAEHDPNAALPFTVFVALLLDWVEEWNTRHPSQALAGRTPLQAWLEDPTPIEDVPAEQLATFALEDDGRLRTITTSGVSWRRRRYVAPWMAGLAGTRVRLRYLPHHDHQIEVFDAQGRRHLGCAHLADQATPEQRAALRRTQASEKRRLQKALATATRQRNQRYAAVTTAAAPERLGALTGAEAEAGLAPTQGPDLAARALPDLIPPTEPPASWARPLTRPAGPAATGSTRAASRRAATDRTGGHDEQES